MSADIRLMELLCTRLCHDITGPVGAIANGAELLEEGDAEMKDQAMELITQSGREAVNRLQFYRMAYGKISGRGEACLADYKTLIKNFFGGGKITLDWPDSHTDAANIPVSRHMARLMLNLVILAAGTLIRGGTISIRLQQREHEKMMIVSASGMTVKWDEHLQKALNLKMNIDALEPHTVQAYFTGAMVKEQGMALGLQQGTDTFEFTLSQREEALAV